MCKGPHIANTSRVKAFKITKNSASLWLSKQGNDQLQRVYGISFPDKKEFAEWKHFQEQAAKRDHRKIGLEQELFYFDELSPAARSKCPSWQCPGSAPSPPQGTTPGGSGQFLTPRARPNH